MRGPVGPFWAGGASAFFASRSLPAPRLARCATGRRTDGSRPTSLGSTPAYAAMHQERRSSRPARRATREPRSKSSSLPPTGLPAIKFTIGRRRPHLSPAMPERDRPVFELPAMGAEWLKSARGVSEHSREEPGPRAGSGGRCAQLCWWNRSGSRRGGPRRCDDAGMCRRVVGRHAASEHGRRIYSVSPRQSRV